MTFLATLYVQSEQNNSSSSEIDKPVKREIFAIDFWARVVHQWLINNTNG